MWAVFFASILIEPSRRSPLPEDDGTPLRTPLVDGAGYGRVLGKRRRRFGWATLSLRRCRSTLVGAVRSCLAVGMVFAVQVCAQAQSNDVDAYIGEGIAARRRGDDDQALVLFAQAWELGHSPRARAQMGLAEQALGAFVESESCLVEALAAGSDPG